MQRRRRSDSPRAGPRVPTHPAAQAGAPLSILVVKIGGRAQGDPRLPAAIAAAARPQVRLVVAHGGGDEVSALQRRMGVEPQFVGGRRVTRPEDLDAVRMVLSGTVNKRLVAQFQTAGVRAVGVSGEDGGLLTARVTDPAFGRVGRDVFADASLVAHLVNGDWVPVVSPLARDRESPTGDGLNVNGDDAAAALAAGLGADELVFVADVPGVLEDGRPLPHLDAEAIRSLAARGVVQGGMLAKLEAAQLALRNGVRRVRIASLDGIADGGAGTLITNSSSASRGPA